MSGMCKSDAKQNSKNRVKFAAQAQQNTWSTHKDKISKRVKKLLSKKTKHLIDRALAGKPEKGHARRIRRECLQVNINL